MALYKEITQDNGIILTYHRILFLHSTINMQNSIAALSYIDENAREQEKEGLITPYIFSETFETAYNSEMTIETAYDFLKTIPKFKDAINI